MAGIKRRDVLRLGGAGVLVVGLQRFWSRDADLEYSPVEGAPGWRFARVGQVSAVTSTDFLTIGLDRGPAPLAAAQLREVLYPNAPDGQVPVAVFSDFFCPYCRTLLSRLKARQGGVQIALNWHELPLLGPNSSLVARAAIAADQQGAYVPFYEALLQGGFRPSARWLGQVAQDAGLDGTRLLRDMDAPLVARSLANSAAAAARLGFYATPGIVIGQTAVLGALDQNRMESLFRAA